MSIFTFIVACIETLVSRVYTDPMQHFVASELGLHCMSPVFQSIVSLTSLLRGQLVKCFTTL